MEGKILRNITYFNDAEWKAYQQKEFVIAKAGDYVDILSVRIGNGYMCCLQNGHPVVFFAKLFEDVVITRE